MTGLGYIGDAQTGRLSRDDDPGVDRTEPINFAEAFGIAVEQPSEMERRLHRAGYEDAHPQRTDGRHTHDGKDPS